MERNFNDNEREAVKEFYEHLKAIYQKAFDDHFKNDKRLVIVSKRTWAEDIAPYSLEQIAKGVRWIKQQKTNHVEGWQYFDVGRCVGAIKQANTVKACHKPFKRDRALEDLKAKARADQAGSAAMDQMKGLFP